MHYARSMSEEVSVNQTVQRKPRLNRLAFLAFVFASTFSVVAAVAFQSLDKVTLDGATMGTSYKVVIATGPAEFDSAKLQTVIDARLAEIDALMSTWRDDSELSRFNASTSTDWFPVSSETATVVAESLRVADESSGAFDPTVLPLVRIWNFGKGRRDELTPPTDEQLAAIRPSIGYSNVEVRNDPSALRKKLPGVELDLSGIAKGYAVDAISKLLADRGLKNHLVEIGGEMRASGRKRDGSVWAIGIEKPTELRRDVYSAVPLRDIAIATSGDYRNYYEVDGQRYSHTIDPSTCKPITHKLASVSIFTESCMTADAWATAINVLGPEKGLQVASTKGLAAMLLVREGQSFVETSTPQFRRMLAGTQSDVEPAEGLSVFGTIFAALIVFVIAITGMAVGVIFSNRRIQGSCGGLANMPGHEGSACELCTNPTTDCQERLAEQAANGSSGNAAVEKFSV